MNLFLPQAKMTFTPSLDSTHKKTIRRSEQTTTLLPFTIHHLLSKMVVDNEEVKKRFAIKKSHGIKLLDAPYLSLIQGNGNFCRIVDAQGQLNSISKSIGSLVEEFNPKHFFKTNRSQIVRIKHIVKIESFSKNRLVVNTKGLKELAITSTSSTKEFRNWLVN